MRVAGRVSTQSDDVLVPLHLVEDAVKAMLDLAYDAGCLGVDVSRFGGDRSALVKRQGQVVLEKESKRGSART